MTQGEIIIEARRKSQAGDFHRQIVTRTPFDLHTDLLALNCGHEVHGMHLLLGRAELNAQHCGACAAEWMKTAGPVE